MRQAHHPIKFSLPWNQGKLIGQKAPLKIKEIWGIRIRLQLSHQIRNLALFNLAIDSKLRGCDLVSLRVADIAQGGSILSRAIGMQRKTLCPVQFEITELIKQFVAEWVKQKKFAIGTVAFSKSSCKFKALIYTPICSDCEAFGSIYWPKFCSLWNSHHAKD
ncbi:hypothetical protein HEAR0778 [Herminiimonas arsenicoxydans]|uniref:Tyr recombinase domain-containing protein n=1 Tax=Herminiimonas arsenicoxydans TaxID=204773 RepID=A4G384_HERAR|nr:hypothetical protein HEAR0778 [Herminiimonas arsenicoxydans]